MCTTLLTLFATLLAPQDPPATATELVALQPLCGRELHVAAPPWASLLRYVPQLDRNVDLIAGSDAMNVLSADVVTDLLYSIEGEAIDSGALFLQIIGDNLMVFGEREAVRRTRGWLDEATQIVARPIEVEFAVWDASGRETPPAVLDAAGYARFSKSGPPIWRSLATGRAGDALSLDHTTWQRYVRALEIEVAQKQSLSRPATDLYGVGGHAVVRTFPLLAGDEFAVHLQFAAAQERGLRRNLQTGLPGAAELELPRLESCFGACSGRVPNGGALCATLRGSSTGGGQLVMTARVRSAVPPQAFSRQDLAILPCGALTTHALSQTVPLPRPLEPEGEFVDHGAGAFGMIPADDLAEMARSLLASHGAVDETEVRCDGVHLFVHGPAGAVAAVAALLRGLENQLLQNLELRHLTALEAAPTPTDANAAAAAATLHEIVMPTLLGREVCAFRTLETNVVSNVHIEIAQEASSLRPEVVLLQVGSWLRARCTPVAAGTHVELELVCSDAPMPLTRSVQPGGGVLMAAELATTRLRHDGALASGRTIEHGSGPRVTIDGRAFDTSMTTTIRR